LAELYLGGQTENGNTPDAAATSGPAAR
jgi:hypothetical protein